MNAKFLGTVGQPVIRGRGFTGYGSVLLGVISLLWNFLSTTNAEDRRKVKVIFWGTVVGMTPIVLLIAAQDAFQFSSPVPMTNKVWWKIFVSAHENTTIHFHAGFSGFSCQVHPNFPFTELRVHPALSAPMRRPMRISGENRSVSANPTVQNGKPARNRPRKM
ncbi:MAG: hypothetical protein WA655_07970 [Candidatus Korobacteraceae bacterium]